jgi:energy-coupling factor transporter ATP-binding protein EcfA2
LETHEFYIKRRIKVGEEVLSEQELLSRSDLIILLAQPGAGKTELLKHFAKLLQARSLRAAVFRHSTEALTANAVIIDAMDEVAKVSENDLWDIFAKARMATGTVIFSSRSSEWENARTKLVEDYFGKKPTIASLIEFDQDEQRQLFEHTFPKENFELFFAETQRFELNPLLGNPQFLQILGHAYIQNNRQFTSKLQIYSDAATRLANEQNPDRSSRGRLESSVIVRETGNIFANLLLSGASGVAVKETIENRDFPYIGIFKTDKSVDPLILLDSQLFKQANTPNEHEPVHRIIAEFLAAKHVVTQFEDTTNRVSLGRCLAIIAPNGVVRDELRGLFGWMAALGNRETQKQLIELDPYAVLANGDPSQLVPTNKVFLIKQLINLSEHDPYFRRSDYWRSFNIGKFFTNETIAEIKPILSGDANSHLKGLFLELIAGTSIIFDLSNELETLALTPSESRYNRIEAYTLLLNCYGYNATHTMDQLIAEASPTSLQMATKLVSEYGAKNFKFEEILALLQKLPSLYSESHRTHRTDGYSHYFLTQFFKILPTDRLEDYLDTLTSDLECECGEDRDYLCKCRFSRSKVIGPILDLYFQNHENSHASYRIWQWLKNLRFPGQLFPKDSSAVAALTSDHILRREIHVHAFNEACSEEEYRNLRWAFFDSHRHSGLQMTEDDQIEIVNYAYEHNNVNLWKTFCKSHNYYGNRENFQNPTRTLMRAQSRDNPQLMAIWSQNNRNAKLEWQETRRRFPSRKSRYDRRERKQLEASKRSLRDNIDIIEAGKHWGWLRQFAHLFLHTPDQLEEAAPLSTVEKSLTNCIPFLSEHAPSLEEIGQNGRNEIAEVLYAACLMRWRKGFSLSEVPAKILKAIKTEVSSSTGVSNEEVAQFELKLDHLLFPHRDDIEKFARELVEPGLSKSEHAFTFTGFIQYKDVFRTIRAELALEWLIRFPDMPFEAERTLFSLMFPETPSKDIKELIANRVTVYLPQSPEDLSVFANSRRMFWLLNSFFHDNDPAVWNELGSNKQNLLAIAERSERFHGDDDILSPPLSAEKLYNILTTFFDHWPEVELPSSFGTSSPPEEKAYRYLSGTPSRIGRNSPETAIPVLDRLLDDEKFVKFRSALLSEKAFSMRKMALGNFYPPSPSDISALFRNQDIASVEDLRTIVVESLGDLEQQIRQSETDTLETFYSANNHIDENTARNRLVDLLKGQMTALNLSVEIERHMKDSNRCDITVASMIDCQRRLLMIEVKGQWHRELFTAASVQLDQRYSSHPEAEEQGIYLVLWFGTSVSVAGKTKSTIKTPEELRTEIIDSMPREMHGRIDVVVMNLSRSS